ncbi:hypothetical protein OQA88_115 [Cercophora sp. LCS_1]
MSKEKPPGVSRRNSRTARPANLPTGNPQSRRSGGPNAENTMILGPVSYLDLIELPVSFVRERWLRAPEKRSLFVQKATPFEDFVIRCVRYAFANIPAWIGRVFFSRAVAQPFLKFRMLRHGFLTCPIHWREHQEDSFKGIWAVRHPRSKPDIVLYYIHGGGFSMGSSYFYLEFLLTWLSVLVSAGYENPAIFALEYTLVPDAYYPTQLHEAKAAYRHVLEVAGDPSIVCISGDSAGAMLALSLLLHLADERFDGADGGRPLPKPALATLISPWVTLVSDRENTTESDYLDVHQLNKYGRLFAGDSISEMDPLVSPGCCKDISWWKRASPLRGIFITYGNDEILAPDIEGLIRILGEAGVVVGDQVARPRDSKGWKL